MQKMLDLVAFRRIVRVVANTCSQAASASFTDVSISFASQMESQLVHATLLWNVIERRLNFNRTQVTPSELRPFHLSPH